MQSRKRCHSALSTVRNNGIASMPDSGLIGSWAVYLRDVDVFNPRVFSKIKVTRADTALTVRIRRYSDEFIDQELEFVGIILQNSLSQIIWAERAK